MISKKEMLNVRNYKLIFLLFFCQFYFPSLLFSQGDLLITPKRVVFEGGKQREMLNLVNIGRDTATYSLSFIQYNMNEDGSFEIIQEPDSGQMFADSYLRIFPRIVTLAPSEPQVIMLQYRRKANMRDGEYRSHLYFRSEENYKPLGLNDTVSTSTLLSVQLVPIYGLSIPVIIRSGSVHSSVTLSNIHLHTLEDGTQDLSLVINREGNKSVYGDIIIDYIPERGKAIQIAGLKGVGVYTNINRRELRVKLNNSSNTLISSGSLHVKYIGLVNNKNVIFSEENVKINP